MTKTVLVLGATGGVGGATARAMARRGWHVRALTRRLRDGMDDFEWVLGDAEARDDVVRAARGADAIVHAVNPPGYRGWGRLVLPMIDNSIAAAEAADARLVLPGTVYNYDPAANPVVSVATPQRPTTRKGAIRVELERRMAASSARTLIVRAGDFFGPRPGGSWFSQGLVAAGKPVKAITYPSPPGVGHGWAYLPDVGETFARLLDADGSLPHDARYHMAGVWDADGTELIAAIRRALDDPALPVRRTPWWALPLVAPFSEMMREMIEMRPFWDHPMRFDNAELVAALGAEPHTPLDEAVRTTLSALGCTPRRPATGRFAFA